MRGRAVVLHLQPRPAAYERSSGCAPGRASLKPRSSLGTTALSLTWKTLQTTTKRSTYCPRFCLSPPGDTFTRRGFWDALLVGCIPVVFDDRSRYWPTFFEFGDARAVSVLLPAAELAANETVLEEHLRAYLPLVPAMQRAIAQQATGFQWAFSDLSEDEHAAVGPDALDIALHSLSARASKCAVIDEHQHSPRSQSVRKDRCACFEKLADARHCECQLQ